MKFYAGVDGGGTKTRAIIIKENGEIIGIGNSGPSNFNDIGIDKAISHINTALKKATQENEFNLNRLNSIFLGLGGVLTKNDKILVKDNLLNYYDKKVDFYIENDTRISLAGGLAGKEGIVLIVGTGSICYGRTIENNEWQTGGWGPKIDDVGSGYYLGIEALKALVRSKDGRLEETKLTDSIYNKLNISNINQIIRVLYYNNTFNRTKIASLSKLVVKHAINGDEIACNILDKATDELTLLVETVVDKLGYKTKEIPLTVTGGLAHSHPIFEKLLYKKIQESIPNCKIIDPIMSPLKGAALCALKKEKIKINNQIIKKLLNS